MAKEHWYFLCGVLLVLVPLLVLVAVKKLRLMDVRPAQTVVYSHNAEQPLSLHVFPAKGNSKAAAPALLMFHGGAWLFGHPDHFYPQCEFFSAQGFACFSAQYRLGTGGRPDVRGAIADARAAFDYLLTHAKELHIDPQRVAVAGSSAGGHLAAALGSGLPKNSGAAAVTRPFAQLLYNPMLDLSPGKPDHHLVTDYWLEVSPHHHIDGAVPPALILVGSDDPEVPVPTAQAFCDAIHQAGGQCEIALYEGQGHGFFHDPVYRDQTNQRVLAFLKSLKMLPE